MRIPYPERIPYSWATLGAALLFIVQIAQGTSLEWAGCGFCFIMLAVAGTNLAGGLYRPAGAFIFFNAMLTFVIGVIAKALFGEPADSNLQAPMRLVEVYLAGMAGMCGAALIEHVFRPKESLLTRWFRLSSLRNIFIGVAAAGVVVNLVWDFASWLIPPILVSLFRFGNDLLSFGIILGVMYCVRSSNGKRSLNPFLICVIILMTVQGLLNFTKQGLFAAPFCWVLGAGASRFRLRAIHLVVGGIVAFILFYFCIPVVQTGKSQYQYLSWGERYTATVGMFENFGELRAQALEHGVDDYSEVNYYNQSEGFLDRLEMIGVDDLLIAETDRDGFFGYEPTKEGWENLVPHFIWAGKPTPYFGNYYAHQLYLLDDNDYTTGVSFSPSADAYKQGGFVGVVVVETLCFIAVFLIVSWITGDIRDHPVAIILVLYSAHIAPEGAMPGMIQLIFLAVLILVMGFFARYFAPIISSAVLPPERLESGALVTALD